MTKKISLTSLAIALLTTTACAGPLEEPRPSAESEAVQSAESEAAQSDSAQESPAADMCGHNIDLSTVSYGYNTVVDKDGNQVAPQGKPFQEGYGLMTSADYIEDQNSREYAQILAYMGSIRDVLMCDVETTSEDEWLAIAEILTLNSIKTTQSLTGTPQEQYYSTSGIYDHLKNDGEDLHPMMKYLEEAELELKCLAFTEFDFTNPDGQNHCQIHNVEEESGLVLPAQR
jgi:hypothetical protein